MAPRNQDFQTVTTQGALLPPDILRRIRDAKLEGLRSPDYGLPKSLRTHEAVGQAWTRARAHWKDFQDARTRLVKGDPGTTITRNEWLFPLLEILGFGKLPIAPSPEIEGKKYPIRHFWGSVPFHLLGCRVEIDKRTQGVQGAATTIPHSMVQEFLNRSEEHLWAVMTNGLKLRLLRDNHSLSRQAYLEFDLETMLESEVYSDFSLLWHVLHVSRFDALVPEECWLERWTKVAEEEGARVLGGLRKGVEDAIQVLGQGFVGDPRNEALRAALREGRLAKQDYYRQLLRTVYRLLFLFVAEDRGLLHPPGAPEDSRQRYQKYYSLQRLRDLSDRIRGTGHGDLWAGLSLVFGHLEKSGCPALGLDPLGSFLWARSSTPDLLGPGQVKEGAVAAHLANDSLLAAIRSLAFATMDGIRRPIDYRNLGAEELGSVYESLLELSPTMRAGETAQSSAFRLFSEAGHERKTTGSYYTPDSLVQCLLDSALEPVVQQRLEAAGKDPAARESALLGLTVCDPAVGSGHFLIAAAHRLARHLARVRTGDTEPAPEDYRRALRDVIGRCLYGVDLNPMSAELCRVALWMEAMEPGRPLSFLDHHIQVGNSLMGATPELIRGGVPEGAFTAIEGDEKPCCAALKKRNKAELKLHTQRVAQGGLFGSEAETTPDDLAERAAELEKLEGQTVADEQQRETLHRELRDTPQWRQSKLAADAWCAAFVWRKDGSELAGQCPTSKTIGLILADPEYAAKHPAQVVEIQRLAEQYRFFHWHLAFPHVLAWHDQPPVPAEASA
jgi:hypothetical protein